MARSSRSCIMNSIICCCCAELPAARHHVTHPSAVSSLSALQCLPQPPDEEERKRGREEERKRGREEDSTDDAILHDKAGRVQACAPRRSSPPHACWAGPNLKRVPSELFSKYCDRCCWKVVHAPPFLISFPTSTTRRASQRRAFLDAAALREARTLPCCPGARAAPGCNNAFHRERAAQAGRPDLYRPSCACATG